MITRPQLEKFRKGDLVQYFNNVLDIVTEERATVLKIEKQRSNLAEIMERFNVSWQPNRGSELTPQIKQLDEERGSLFMGLKLTVDAWALHHYNKDFKNAAFLISDKIGAISDSVPRMRYQQETATLNALISDFKDELKEEIKLLGLNKWVEILQNVNNSFDEKYLERTIALSSEQEGVVLQLRTEASESFRKLISIFEARMLVAEAEEENMSAYETMKNMLNELTEQYNEAVQKKE